MNDMNNMISCKDVVDLIMDYIENSLEPEAVKDFDMHIDGCECCHAFINTYKKTISLTHQISKPLLHCKSSGNMFQFRILFANPQSDNAHIS